MRQTLLSVLLAACFVIPLAGCGSSFFQNWAFEGADLSGGVDDQGEVDLLVGINASAYEFEGRLEIGISTLDAQVLLCFISAPDSDDPWPICYPIPIERWNETTNELESASERVRELDIEPLRGREAYDAMVAAGLRPLLPPRPPPQT